MRHNKRIGIVWILDERKPGIINISKQFQNPMLRKVYKCVSGMTDIKTNAVGRAIFSFSRQCPFLDVLLYSLVFPNDLH